MKEAESGIAKALAALRQAENDYQRYSRLIEKDATSVQQYDAAVAQYEAAKASLDEMETRKAQLLVQSSRQYVTAPVDGKVLVLYRNKAHMFLRELHLHLSAISAIFIFLHRLKIKRLPE